MHGRPIPSNNQVIHVLPLSSSGAFNRYPMKTFRTFRINLSQQPRRLNDTLRRSAQIWRPLFLRAATGWQAINYKPTTYSLIQGHSAMVVGHKFHAWHFIYFEAYITLRTNLFLGHGGMYLPTVTSTAYKSGTLHFHQSKIHDLMKGGLKTTNCI